MVRFALQRQVKAFQQSQLFARANVCVGSASSPPLRRRSGRNAAPGEAIPSTGQFWQAKAQALPRHVTTTSVQSVPTIGMRLSLLRKCQVQRTTFRNRRRTRPRRRAHPPPAWRLLRSDQLDRRVRECSMQIMNWEPSRRLRASSSVNPRSRNTLSLPLTILTRFVIASVFYVLRSQDPTIVVPALRGSVACFGYLRGHGLSAAPPRRLNRYAPARGTNWPQDFLDLEHDSRWRETVLVSLKSGP
jgi:hypothetical protein